VTLRTTEETAILGDATHTLQVLSVVSLMHISGLDCCHHAMAFNLFLRLLVRSSASANQNATRTSR
jgi:hypothetical protein